MLENELWCRWSNARVGEWAVMCDVGKEMEGLENELWHLCNNSFSNPSITLPTSQLILPMSQLILQPFCCFTYITAHSPILPSLYLRHSSFSNPCCFTYVTAHSSTRLLLLLRHWLFTYVTWRAAHVTLLLRPLDFWGPHLRFEMTLRLKLQGV